MEYSAQVLRSLKLSFSFSWLQPLQSTPSLGQGVLLAFCNHSYTADIGLPLLSCQLPANGPSLLSVRLRLVPFHTSSSLSPYEHLLIHARLSGFSRPRNPHARATTDSCSPGRPVDAPSANSDLSSRLLTGPTLGANLMRGGISLCKLRCFSAQNPVFGTGPVSKINARCCKQF